MDRKETKRKITNQEELKEPAGGWPSLRDDAYTAEEYSKAGIIWKHYWAGKDEYINKYTGVSMTQQEAQWRTKAHNRGEKVLQGEMLDDFLKWERNLIQIKNSPINFG